MSPQLAVAIAAVVVILLMGIEGGLINLNSTSRPLLVTVQKSLLGNGSTDVDVSIRATTGTIDLHAAVLPGTSESNCSHPFYAFYDSTFPLKYANPNDVLGLVDRVQSYFRELGVSCKTSLVDAASLSSTLAASPNATLLDFGFDTLPSQVLSATSDQLETWIRGGGTLIWAGGPLAYYEGGVNSAGQFIHDDLGWAGQTKLVGFPLTDPIGYPSAFSAGPVYSNFSTPLGRALDLEYTGTADGANISQVTSHGGSILGFLSEPGNSTPSVRTSLAIVPVGLGRVIYFGGGIWADHQTVPSADLELSSDIALLVAYDFAPSNGPVNQAQLVVPAGESQTITFFMPSGETSAILVVYSQVVGALIYYKAQQLEALSAA